MGVDRGALAKLQKRHINGLYSVAVAMTGEAKRLATRHTDNGTRRNSITQTKKARGVLWGIPKRSAPHAPYLELGFKPHWVPMRHIALWAKRHNVGQIKATTNRGRSGTTRRYYKRARATALGVYVGGPGSTLQHGGGGAAGTFFMGRSRVRRTYRTKGGRSKYLRGGKVGHPILRPVARERLRSIAPSAFVRGYRRG